MDKDLYARQDLLNLKEVPSATVVGVGGTGSWVALFLAMSGCPLITLMDADVTEKSNFNRLPIQAEGNIGAEKTLLMEQVIKSLRPDCEIICTGKATQLSLPTTEGLIFDCTDSQPVQAMVYKFATENGRNYIRCGYDGTHITVTDRVPKWGTAKGLEKEGYEVFPSWVVPAALAGACAVAKAMHEPNLKMLGDIGSFISMDEAEWIDDVQFYRKKIKGKEAK